MNYSLDNIIECLLLVSDEPLTISQILKILDDKKITKKKIESSISNLNERYVDRAIHIKHVASGYRFQAKTGLEVYISKLRIRVPTDFQKHFLRQLQ